MIRTFSLAAVFFSLLATLAAAEPERTIVPAKTDGRPVEDGRHAKKFTTR